MAVPTDDPSYVLNLKAIRANLAQMVANETAVWATNGPKPSYDLDGRHVQWTEWLQGMQDKMAAMDKAIQAVDQPYELAMRGYT